MKVGEDALLAVEDLAIAFSRDGMPIQATRGLSFSLPPGGTLGIVGESGSGKSVTALALMGLLPRSARVTAAQLRFAGQDLRSFSDSDWRRLRGSGISMIFQDPMTSLNPLMRCGEQVAEVLRMHRHLDAKAARSATVALFEEMNLPEPEKRVNAYPFELSGGQRQRVMIAMALAGRPRLLIADEPTTALDVTVQAQILKLLGAAQKQYGMALILITHDLGVVRDCVENVMVMYAGNVVEQGSTHRVLNHAVHPYTRGLLRSIPNPDNPRHRLEAIPGTVPPAYKDVPGCRFHPRCGLAMPACREIPSPQLMALPALDQQVACPVALKGSIPKVQA